MKRSGHCDALVAVTTAPAVATGTKLDEIRADAQAVIDDAEDIKATGRRDGGWRAR